MLFIVSSQDLSDNLGYKKKNQPNHNLFAPQNSKYLAKKLAIRIPNIDMVGDAN